MSIEQAVAAPLCSRHLADLGADVIKVERPDGGDFARGYDTFVEGMSSHFVWLNYRKRSVVLDLKSTGGKESLSRLLETADVFISNLGPGAVERIVAFDEIERHNPGLVTCQISGYGPEGPYRHRKAFDLLVQGEAGVTASTGLPGRPAKPGVSLADLGAGIYATTAILAALRTRDLTGSGDRIDIAMFDVLAEWMSPLLLAFREGGVTVEPAGTRHATITPYGPFALQDGTVMNIAVQNDRQWVLLCSVLELDELADDERVATNKGRLAHRDEVEAAVAGGVWHWERAELEAALEDAGVPWGRLNGVPEVAAHPQLEQAGRWHTVALPHGRHASVVASPFRFGAHRLPGGAPGVPELGEHTEEVMNEVLNTKEAG